ncbi:hypothetical protein Trydic_g12771 [Trypoxylus dichotomus]
MARVFKSIPRTRQALKVDILQEIRALNHEILQRVPANFQSRLRKSLEKRGGNLTDEERSRGVSLPLRSRFIIPGIVVDPEASKSTSRLQNIVDLGEKECTTHHSEKDILGKNQLLPLLVIRKHSRDSSGADFQVLRFFHQNPMNDVLGNLMNQNAKIIQIILLFPSS